jgi:hypothetical protein
MKALLTSILKPIAEGLFAMVNAVTPDGALVIYVLVFVAAIAWVWTLKNESEEKKGDGMGPILGDLRVWATIILGIQIVIYVVFK